MGVRTLYNNTQGSNNVAIGNGLLFSNTTGVYNVAIGGAMTSNTEGLYNIAIGDGALTRNETGRDNIAIGSQALYLVPHLKILRLVILICIIIPPAPTIRQAVISLHTKTPLAITILPTVLIL